nr:reverse transcriptase domain-containing protein [Tanacetum cinerariifolium]
MLSHIETYDGSEEPEDHLKTFQTAAKTERWAMPTWCHMFNSTLKGNARVWFDDLPPESIDSYDDLKKAFLENYLQQKKYIKDPIDLHNIKQRDGESTKDFVRRYKLESRDVKGAPECMRISGFVHRITNPKLIKRLHDKIPKIVDEMMRRPKRKQDRFTLLTKTPKEIFSLEKGKFKAPPPMTTPVEKRNHTKFCEFHGEVGHNTDGCMHLKKQIKEMLKAGKLSYLIKELKQNNRKEQPKTTKKGETPGKEKPVGHPNDEGIEGPMIIETEIGGHCIHRMYVDVGSASEILYEHCFNRLHREIKNQLVPAITHLIGFSGEVIWPIGQIQLLVIIGDEEHSASAWMNFVVIRSSSSYNGIIERPVFRKLQAVLSTAHGMLKIPVEGGIITLKSIMLVPLECAMVSGPEGSLLVTKPMVEERIKVEINPEHPEQTIMIGSTLTEEGLNKLCSLLQRNLDIFAWKLIDELPMLTAPMEKEELIVYLAAAKETILFTDGSSCTDGSEAGMILTNPVGMEFTYALRFRFDATNTEEEYDALISKLKIAEQMGVKKAPVVEKEGDTWMTPIFKYLTDGTLPTNTKKARAVKRPLQANYVLREIHEESCSMHASTRSVMAKALRTGYYWPTKHKDARALIRACQGCQVHTPIPRNPQQNLTPITSPWPFYKWRIDIAGPFPEGSGKFKFLIVAIDYFIK